MKEGDLFSYTSQFLLFCVLNYSLQPSETVPSQVWGRLEKLKFLAKVSSQNIEIENGFA